MKDKLFQRTLDNKCPICNKSIEEGETVIEQYNKAKLKIHKAHIKYEK